MSNDHKFAFSRIGSGGGETFSLVTFSLGCSNQHLPDAAIKDDMSQS